MSSTAGSVDGSGSEGFFEGVQEIPLERANALTNEDVSMIISERLTYGTAVEESLCPEDVQPLQELFKIARDSNEEFSTRQSAMQNLFNLGLWKDLPDSPAWSDFQFGLRGYIRLLNLAGDKQPDGDLGALAFFELLQDLEIAMDGWHAIEKRHRWARLKLLLGHVTPVFSLDGLGTLS